MKKFLSCLLILSVNECYAGTGGARDGILFVLSICVILLLLLAAGYIIDFLKMVIRNTMIRKSLKEDLKDQEEESVDPWAEAVPA